MGQEALIYTHIADEDHILVSHSKRMNVTRFTGQRGLPNNRGGLGTNIQGEDRENAISADNIIEREAPFAILGWMRANTVTSQLRIDLRICQKTLRFQRLGVASLEHIEVCVHQDLGKS